MPDPTGMPGPWMSDNPQAIPDYFDVQRKQMMAQMLMQNAQQTGRTPQDWNSMRLVPRRSPLSSIAQVLSGGMAGYGMNKAQDATKQYYQSLMGPAPQGQPQSPQGPPGFTPQGDPQGPTPQAAGAPSMPPQGAGVSQGASQGAPTGGLPNQGFGAWKAQLDASPEGRYMRMLEPGKYAQVVAEQSAKWNMPPDKVKEVLAARLPPDVERQALQNLAMPVTGGERPGMPRMRNGQVIGYAPDPSAGAYYDIGPNGEPVAQKIPGQQKITTETAGLTEAEKQANTPRMIPQGGGVEKLGYPPTPPALAGAGGAAAHSSYFPKPKAPPSGDSAPQGMWGTVPKLPIPNTPGQSSDAFHMKLLDNAAAKHAELVNQYGKDADLADQKMQYNNEAMKTLPTAEVGPMSEWLTHNRAALLEAGIPAGLIPGSGTVTPTMELNKQLKNTALQGARQIYGSRMTQTEVKLQTDEMSPSSHMTADAIQSLIHQDNIKQAYAKQRAVDYDKYVASGGDPTRFEQWYSSKMPLTRFAAKQATPQAAIDRLKKRPELKGDFNSKYGWKPYAGE